MSPSQASIDAFPRLTGADNFDVWKTRVTACLDGKHLLGFVTKENYDGVSDDEDDSDASDMSDVEEAHVPPALAADGDGAAAEDAEEPDDDASLDPDSGSSDDDSKLTKPPKVISFAARKAELEKERAKAAKAKAKRRVVSSSELRRMEAKTKAFLMKTLDNTHIRLVKNLASSFEIFKTVCEKYEGAAAHGDPYYIQHFLLETKLKEGDDLTEFFLKLENAMEASAVALESDMKNMEKSLLLFHAMPTAWKDDLRVWKGTRKYIPYAELKQSIEAKVWEQQAQDRYMLIHGTPGSAGTKGEKALAAEAPVAALAAKMKSQHNACSYCARSNHEIRDCRVLQKDLRNGQVKANTVLPANFAFINDDEQRNQGQKHRSHPYARNQRNGSAAANGRYGQTNQQSGPRSWTNGPRNQGRSHQGGRGSGRGGYQQQRRDQAMIAISGSAGPKTALSLTAKANEGVSLDPTWTIDSGCTRHVSHESTWFTTKASSDGSITVGGKNEIPIEATGQIEVEVVDSKGQPRTLKMDNVLYAPQLKFSLFSVPAAVKEGFRFAFRRQDCSVQTDQRFNIKAKMAEHADLYQFQAAPIKKKSEAHVAAQGTA